MWKMNELENALAVLYKRKGKSHMTEKEIVFAASMDFRWYTPKEAQKFLETAMDSGLLAETEDGIAPTFDYKGADIPKGFKPSGEILKTPAAPKGLFLQIVDDISKAKDMPRQEIIARVNNKQERMGIEAEVAALIIMNELELDTSEFLEKVESEIQSKVN